MLSSEGHRGLRSIAQETLQPSLPTSKQAMFSSSTRSTDCRDRSKRCCIRRWRTFNSTSWSGRVRPLGRTRVGRVAPPLRDRFGYVARIDYYESDDISAILHRSAAILNVDITEEGSDTIARRSRGTPRVANRLLRRVRDYAAVRADGHVDGKVADRALEVFEVDDMGLDKVDRAILDAIVGKFGGGPVGLSTLAIAVGEEPETVEDAYEPFLLLEGFLQRTPRGRIATERAYEHLGVERAGVESPQGRLLD